MIEYQFCTEQLISQCDEDRQKQNKLPLINYYFTSPTQEDVGLTKSIVDTYLMNDGLR